MDDPLTSLEERLEQLVPRGLSDGSRARLDEQIETLAAEAEASSSTRRRGRWVGAGIAAAVAATAGGFLLRDAGGPRSDQTNADLPAAAGDGFEPVAVLERTVGDVQYDATGVDNYGEAKHSWNKPMRVTELVRHKETGLQVRIMQESREVLRVDVSSF